MWGGTKLAEGLVGCKSPVVLKVARLLFLQGIFLKRLALSESGPARVFFLVVIVSDVPPLLAGCAAEEERKVSRVLHNMQPVCSQKTSAQRRNRREAEEEWHVSI